MRRTHPLQRFLDRHRLSQSHLALAIGVTRETVNRWIRQHTVPGGTNLLRVMSFAREIEPGLDAGELFAPPAQCPEPASAEERLIQMWGLECSLCRVPWDLATEHLPLGLLDPGLEAHPLGDLCEACARRVELDRTEARRDERSRE